MNTRIAILYTLLLGCAGSSDFERQLCDTRALTAAQLQADKLCPLDKPWGSCPDAPRIERELKAAMEACP